MTGRAPARITVGDFRDVIDIYEDKSDDTDEQQSFTGLPYLADIPALVQHDGGHEREQTTFTKYLVTFHYVADITTSMQVSVTQGDFAGKTLNVGEVEPVRVHGRPRYLRLHCQEMN